MGFEHVVRPGEVAVDETLLNSLRKMQHPRTIAELHSSLGLCNLGQLFILGYNKIATTLNGLLHKEMPTNLSPFENDEDQTFRQFN